MIEILAQIAQAVRIRKNEEIEIITTEIMDNALEQHVLIALQRRFIPTLFDRIIQKKKDK